MSIILRLNKGSELTYAEVDGNFQSLFYSGSLIGTELTFYYPSSSLSQSFDLSVIPGFGGVEIQKDGTTIVNAATGINFTGGVTVTANGNLAVVDVVGGGGGGDTYTLLAGSKSGTKVPLTLDALTGADSTVNLAEGTGIIINQVSSTEIEISASAGGTYTNSTPTPQNFPGNSPFDNISTGTTFSNKTFTEMMDLMLYPELFPTLTNPSQTFTLSPSGFREIGEQFSAGGITLSSTFNRGSISPAYGTNGFRSGLPNSYIYTGGGSVPSPQSSTSLTNNTATTAAYTVVQGAQSWTARVAYDAGQQPLSSKGNNFNSPLPAGQTSIITRTITGVYPPFATTVSLGTLTKQSLQSMSQYVQVSLVTESGGGGQKQTVDIPDAFSTITGIQQFNTLNNTWEAIQLSTFTVTTTTHTIQGNTVNYDRYTHNGNTIGARQLRFLV